MGRPRKPQFVVPGPGRPGVWRTRIDGRYHYLSGVGRHEKPLAGSGTDAIPVKVWDWLRTIERRQIEAATAGSDPTVYWLSLAYLKWAESERDAGRLSDGQWKGQRSRLKLFLTFPGVSDARAARLPVETVQAFLESIREIHAAEYVAGVGRTIRTLFRWAARPIPGRSPLRYIPSNPLDGYQFPRAAPSREGVDPSHVRRFLRWAWARARSAPGHSRRFDRLFLLMIQFQRLTGCRPGEACSLRWDQWDRGQGKIVLRDHKTARKTGKARTIWVTDPVARLLRAIERLDGRNDEWVFTHRRGVGAIDRGHLSARAGEPWPDGSSASARLRRIRSQAIAEGLAGIESTGPKRLVAYVARHGYASHAVDSGLTIEQTAELLGNTAAVTAAVYVHSIEAGARGRASDLAKRGAGR